MKLVCRVEKDKAQQITTKHNPTRWIECVFCRNAMNKIFSDDAFQSVVKIKLKSACIDNLVFRLHYMLTAPLLLILSVGVTLYQFFGEPISCMQRDDIPTRVINTYCWIESTFSLPKSLDKEVGDQIVYPGVERYQKGDQVKEHAYYQWVCLVLFLQCTLFYATRVIWESWEGGTVGKLLMELENPLLKNEDIEEKSQKLCSYFVKNLGRHDGYAVKYFICELLNVVNVIGQIYFIDRFLGGEFSTYGYEVFRFMRMADQRNRTDPMVRVFPRMAKCTFHKFGSAGSVQTHDSLCILPLNILNEKIYAFLWFWLIVLAVVSILAIVYRIGVMTVTGLRSMITKRRNRVLDKDVTTVVEYIGFGDWFLLNLLGKSIHSFNFSKFFASLEDRIKVMIDEERDKEDTVDSKKSPRRFRDIPMLTFKPFGYEKPPK